MSKLKPLFFSMVLVAAGGVPAVAQDSFDLSSQRSEIQHFNKIPGEKLDHQGIIINPTPHSMEVDRQSALPIASGFDVKDPQKAFADQTGFLARNPKGVKVRISFGAKQAARAGVKDVSGAYSLSIGKKGIDIVGYDETGAFYGLQTLRQILESPVAAQGSLPYMTVTDYPDMLYRGVVEGFYGTPWSHEVRLSLIDFYGRNKMNNYLYGPKDDPYHSSPYWRLPYPADEARNIRELVEACKRNHVDFVWAIHPGKDIRWNEQDYDSLVAKFNMMYDLGVRSFAVFFDDIEGEGTRADKQVDLLNRLTSDFVKAKGDVSNLIVCPTDYSRLWANPGPNGQLAYYGNHLDPSVEVFYTGDVVCSDLTPNTMEFVNTLIQRPAFFWWNYPVSDYCRNYILQGPVYGLDTSLTSKEVAGLESNPMEHGEASKLALYGVADYAWNMGAYNPIDNWERGIELLVPDAPEAYRTFAIHSGDTETGYRRDESWETTIFPFDHYTPEQFDALRAEFEAVEAVPAAMEQSSNKALLQELRPWLAEFGKLGTRGRKALDLIKLYEAGNDSAFWTAYIGNLMTQEDREAYEAHKSGTMKLQPFYENAMDQMLLSFYTNLSGEVPMSFATIGSYPNLRTTLGKLMLDNDTTTFYTSANSQKTGHWIGLDLGTVRPVEEVAVWQGRNSVDDVDYFDNVILEASVDGNEWTALTDSLQNTYIVTWNGQPVDARYVRIRKLPSKKQNWAAVRSFRVNPPTPERVGLGLVAPDLDAALLGFDKNPSTSMRLDGTMSFDRPSEASGAVLLLSDVEPGLTFSQYDASGNLLSERPVATPYARIPFLPGAVRMSLTGRATVYEIVPKF